MKCVACAAVVVLALGVARSDDPKPDKDEERALLQAKTLKTAAESYYTANGRWPREMKDLAKLLEDGENALVDPWGKKFQFKVAPDEKGVDRPYVWTERTVDGKPRVIGTKPPVKKQ